jgi:hypothetical protein
MPREVESPVPPAASALDSSYCGEAGRVEETACPAPPKLRVDPEGRGGKSTASALGVVTPLSLPVMLG